MFVYLLLVTVLPWHVCGFNSIGDDFLSQAERWKSIPQGDGGRSTGQGYRNQIDRLIISLQSQEDTTRENADAERELVRIALRCPPEAS
jgi:hypothetical protein